LPYDVEMDNPEAQIATAAAPLTWRRWLLAAVAGSVTYLATIGVIDVVLDPGHGTGNTGLYASIVFAQVAGTVVAGLLLKARSAKRWIAAFLLTLLSVAALGLIVISPWVFFPSGP
jgi:hypothetical protein